MAGPYSVILRLVKADIRVKLESADDWKVAAKHES